MATNEPTIEDLLEDIKLEFEIFIANAEQDIEDWKRKKGRK